MVSKASLKDGLLLLSTGVVAAVAAWAFWRYLGESAFVMLLIMAVVSLWIDNRRWRRQLGDKPSSGPEQQ